MRALSCLRCRVCGLRPLNWRHGKKKIRSWIVFSCCDVYSFISIFIPYVLCAASIHTYQKVFEPAARSQCTRSCTVRAYDMSAAGSGRTVASLRLHVPWHAVTTPQALVSLRTMYGACSGSSNSCDSSQGREHESCSEVEAAAIWQDDYLSCMLHRCI